MALRPRPLLRLLAVGAAGCLPLAAQEAPEDEGTLLLLLNTPVISASKRLQSPIESPQAVEVITSDQIRASGVFKLTDVLKLATSLQVWDKDPVRTNVTIRGVNPSDNARTIQLLVDGVALFNIISAPIDWNGLPIPIDAIERVEIVRGPSSSLYGANAQMGVISILTKRGAEGGGVSGSLRAAGTDHGGSHEQAYAAYNGDAFSVVASAAGGSNRDTNQVVPVIAHPDIWVSQPNAMHDHQFFLRPEWSLGRNAKLWAMFGSGDSGHFSEFGILPTTLAPILQFPDQAVRRDIAQAGWSQIWSPTFRTEATLNQKLLKFHIGAVQPIPGNPASTAVWNASLAADPGFLRGYDFFDEKVQGASVQANWDPNGTFHMVLGADTKKINTGGSPTLGLKEERNSATGGFVSLDWNVGPLILSAGARAANESLGGSTTSPRASLVWKLSEASVLRTGFFTSKRSPMIQEKDGAINNAVVAYVLIPNPGLKPEDVDSWELGYRHTWARASLDVTFFKTVIKGLISSYRTGNLIGGKPETQFLNNPKAYDDTGLEVSLTGEVATGLLAGFNLATCDFKDPFYGLDQQADFSPKLTANLWTRYRWERLFAYLAVQHVGAYTQSANLGAAVARQDSEAQTLFHVNVGLEFLNGISVSVYGVNANREATPSTIQSLGNALVLHTTRRELGLQASYRF
ncbi:hypothetical protein GETHLI_24630 [Geothrix limicola]|uniref:TonB-dependent receptor n=1 Tax=Geothrix limicola TaxID=2927978 RepID=A0ABQ5QI06_9BACT|nr:TonB-dependent receptor [Geothrix limicola]GLH73961.1 hypothetical protein GETHLI_24630 [Geothrix limicola]